MQTFPSRNQFQNNPGSAALLSALEEQEQELELDGSLLYRSFPLYKDDEGNVITADCVLLSARYGVVAFAVTDSRTWADGQESRRCLEIAEQVPPYIHSRLIKNRALRRTPTQLLVEITPLIFAPLLSNTDTLAAVVLAKNGDELGSFLSDLGCQCSPLSDEVFEELVATIDGAKGLIRPKKRDPELKEGSKGKQAEQLEAAITLFDQQQKHGMMGRITGPQRLRGLAGSGKTVVLAMKAAQTHLQDPDARIAYTFYTKSLYQHVKRLITRFYRQFDDRDPDWENHLHVLHAWGGQSAPGIYSIASAKHNVAPMSYQDAAAGTIGDRFDFVCKSLMKQTKIQPIYDYVFVDEGQDFPISSLRLCHQLARDGRFVLAYDDLQTIFQATTPSTLELFGADEDGKPKVDFEEDIVLYKCYRNPREILVTAHALGLGIYGSKIVQMLESREHWEDIGYFVREGDFTAGTTLKVERPVEHSLDIISKQNAFDEIIKCHIAKTLAAEVEFVVACIKKDLEDGLEPDDILVITVDDRGAKEYLSKVVAGLFKHNIQCNNLHDDTFGIRDFSKSDRVTLATVHKAKGNEAFMVYVLGVDVVMNNPNVRNRNVLFTAMTRAKAWVRVSGVGEGAAKCQYEINTAKKNFPFLIFRYPDPEQVKRMKRDLAASADKRMKARRMLEQLQQEYTDDEITDLMGEIRGTRQTGRKAKKKQPPRK